MRRGAPARPRVGTGVLSRVGSRVDTGITSCVWPVSSLCAIVRGRLSTFEQSALPPRIAPSETDRTRGVGTANTADPTSGVWTPAWLIALVLITLIGCAAARAVRAPNGAVASKGNGELLRLFQEDQADRSDGALSPGAIGGRGGSERRPAPQARGEGDPGQRWSGESPLTTFTPRWCFNTAARCRTINWRTLSRSRPSSLILRARMRAGWPQRRRIES